MRSESLKSILSWKSLDYRTGMVLGLHQGGSEFAVIVSTWNKKGCEKFLPSFNQEVDDITLFLVLLERQQKLSKVPDGLWVSFLLSIVSSSISTLAALDNPKKMLQTSLILSIDCSRSLKLVLVSSGSYSIATASIKISHGAIFISKSMRISKTGSMN